MSVRFSAEVNNGVIMIPKEFRDAFNAVGEVDVELTAKHQTNGEPFDMISELMKNPIKFDGSPLTRDEIYDRKL